jgi:hypothetical protein
MRAVVRPRYGCRRAYASEGIVDAYRYVETGQQVGNVVILV